VPSGIDRALELEPTLAAPAQARRFVRSTLGDGVTRETLDLAELLTSELVTNAIRHGSGQVSVSVRCRDGVLSVSVSVSDDDAAMPVVPPEEPLALGGRGVRMVQRLAQDWGVSPRENGPGKVVWFRLDA
jgi:anti-sigma regulatory factor (Ser/Thr protein kinase)